MNKWDMEKMLRDEEFIARLEDVRSNLKEEMEHSIRMKRLRSRLGLLICFCSAMVSIYLIYVIAKPFVG